MCRYVYYARNIYIHVHLYHEYMYLSDFPLLTLFEIVRFAFQIKIEPTIRIKMAFKIRNDFLNT